MSKVYIKLSTIPNAGKGLFALENIPNKSIIATFKGKLRTTKDKVTNSRSVIRFSDDIYLECDDTDIPSYANDPINFKTERRKLYEALNSDKPFYDMHPGTCINSYIHTMQKKHKVCLVATKDILKDQEIFCHYGFPTWFMTEYMRGFLYEEKMDIDGFPRLIYSYPAFKSYINVFYPTCETYKIETYDDGVCDVSLVHDNKEITTIHLINYASIMRKTTFEKDEKSDNKSTQTLGKNANRVIVENITMTKDNKKTTLTDNKNMTLTYTGNQIIMSHCNPSDVQTDNNNIDISSINNEIKQIQLDDNIQKQTNNTNNTNNDDIRKQIDKVIKQKQTNNDQIDDVFINDSENEQTESEDTDDESQLKN